jgi:hypothetical protein
VPAGVSHPGPIDMYEYEVLTHAYSYKVPTYKMNLWEGLILGIGVGPGSTFGQVTKKCLLPLP